MTKIILKGKLIINISTIKCKIIKAGIKMLNSKVRKRIIKKKKKKPMEYKEREITK